MFKFIIAAQVPTPKEFVIKDDKTFSDSITFVFLPWAPKTMKKKGFGHIKTMLFTIKTSKNCRFWGPRVYI